jgi:hypothetical protein
LSVGLAGSGTAVRVIHPSYCPEIGPICASRDEPPQLHDQTLYVTELRPIFEYQVLEILGLELQVPLRLSATNVVYRRLDRTAFEPDYENIHHRNETLVGLGDSWVSARISRTVGAFALSGRVGVTVPIGRTESNPFDLGERGLPHQHVQFGTGTFNPLLGAEVARTIGQVQMRGYAQAQLSLYENRHGYRAGMRLLAAAEGGMLVLGKLRIAATADMFHEEPERWDGVIQQDGNLGRTDVLVGATIRHPLGDYILTASAKVPVFQHLVVVGPEAGQLSYPAIVNLGIYRTFDITGAPAHPEANR